MSVAEEEIFRHLKTYLIEDCEYEEVRAESEALEQVIGQKRELAFIHGQRGNLDLAKHLKMELGDWTKENQEVYESIKRKEKEAKK